MRQTTTVGAGETKSGFILGSGYRAEENSEEAFSESTMNAFDFGLPPTTD